MNGRWFPSLRYEEIDGLGTAVFDVGASGIEVRVVGNDIARLAHDRKENAFGGASLMGRNDVLEAEDVFGDGFKAL